MSVGDTEEQKLEEDIQNKEEELIQFQDEGRN